MFPYFNEFKIIIFSYWIHAVLPMSSISDKNPASYPAEWNSDIAEYLVVKGLVPNDKDLPNEKSLASASIVKDMDNDVTYLLSKLPDDELIKLLNEQPSKSEYNINDIVKLATKYTTNLAPPKDKETILSKSLAQFKSVFESPKKNKKISTSLEKPKQEGPVFRLEDKELDPFASNRGADPQYVAVQKLNNLLYSHPSEVESDTKNDDEDKKKELLFDVLVAQLKTLCCKRNKPSKKKDKTKLKLKALLNDIMPQPIIQKPYVPEHKYSQTTTPNEHMFLIINDEIKSNGSDDGLISVDPESLGSNSSVMLLGPIATPLSEAQLKIVMMRITNELSKPEYIPLLQQISEGTLSDENIRLVNSLVSGPQTRRYIKPHRCNHQSKLAKVYGGPKWLVCTGYLNLNAASLYD
ncbi:unnamed protein product [Spodoptera littoralis]|uniref:Uncharacterized protein n=1 Tax=Spodoptera littoralis TaxID=7109 RepID=A0A9P0N3Q3_SPOLI|nr:unnamed protein product [Spodoptera littoralis]CAH1643607.1 unnamed protein product [Spodoptera littoralis]